MKKFVFLVAVTLVATGVFAAGNYVQDEGVVTYSNASGDLASGDLVELGGRYGVCLVDIASNQSGAVATKGIFSFRRADTNAVANGASVFYSTAKAVSGTASGKYVGQCVEAVAACTSLTNSAGEFTKYIKVEINAPRHNAVGVTTNFTFLSATGVTGKMWFIDGVLTNVVLSGQ